MASKFRILVPCSGNALEPTTIEVHSNRAELILHRRRECLHDRNITIESYTDELYTIRCSEVSVSSHTEGGSMDVQELSPPVVKARLRMNVHNLRHCARGALGGTAVVDVVFLQQVSLNLFGGRMNLTQLLPEHPVQRASHPGSQRVKKSPPGYALPL